MFNILGFNLLLDAYAFMPRPTNLQPLTVAKIQNGIFNHINISSDATSAYSNVIPTEWTEYTVLDCNFENNIQGGNVDFLGFDTVKIKRRIYGEFAWVTLFTVKIETFSDLFFDLYDWYARTGTTYEYAFVPIAESVEGNYTIQQIDSYFKKNYIADKNYIYEFYAEVQFGSVEQINKTGIFEPLMSKYPVVISNSTINYKKATFSGTIITSEEEEDKTLYPAKNIILQKNITSFLTNKTGKIFKDWNGNSYLISVIDSISIIPNNSTNGKLVSIAFNYVEIGDPENETDLENNNLTKMVGY